jgi:hypothetical protein
VGEDSSSSRWAADSSLHGGAEEDMDEGVEDEEVVVVVVDVVSSMEVISPTPLRPAAPPARVGTRAGQRVSPGEIWGSLSRFGRRGWTLEPACTVEVWGTL